MSEGPERIYAVVLEGAFPFWVLEWVENCHLIEYRRADLPSPALEVAIEAIAELNRALDCMWNDAGGRTVHIAHEVAITQAQAQCKEALAQITAMRDK